MQKRSIGKLGLVLAFLFFMGAACADPILVDPSSTGSSVTIDIDTSECIVPCTVELVISASPESAQAWLDLDEGSVPEFFDITVGGPGYVTDATISAKLAFIAPKIFAVASGERSFFTIFGVLAVTR